MKMANETKTATGMEMKQQNEKRRSKMTSAKVLLFNNSASSPREAGRMERRRKKLVKWLCLKARRLIIQRVASGVALMQQVAALKPKRSQRE